MFKRLRFLSLVLGFILFSHFDGQLFSTEYSFDYQSDELLEQSIDDEDFIAENGRDPLEILDMDEALIDDLLNPEVGADNITYILYARPGGLLDAQLENFWNAVKAQKLNNPAVTKYPPHITLTGFFPYNSKKEQDLIDSLKASLEPVGRIIPIQVNGTQIKQTNGLDYIPIKQSPILHAVAVDFLHGAGVKANFIRPKPDAKLGYHISLREETQGKTTTRVRQLEKANIHLTVPDLQQNTTWALYIYKKTGKNKLEVIYSQPIVTQ